MNEGTDRIIIAGNLDVVFDQDSRVYDGGGIAPAIRVAGVPLIEVHDED